MPPRPVGKAGAKLARVHAAVLRVSPSTVVPPRTPPVGSREQEDELHEQGEGWKRYIHGPVGRKSHGDPERPQSQEGLVTRKVLRVRRAWLESNLPPSLTLDTVTNGPTARRTGPDQPTESLGLPDNTVQGVLGVLSLFTAIP